MPPRRPLTVVAAAVLTTLVLFALFGHDGHEDAGPPPSFRERLAHIRPRDRVPHSRTLGLDEIVVISLPHRKDRRERMTLLANALDADFTFHNGTSYESDEIYTILERARYMRELEGVILQSSSPLTELAPGAKRPQDAPEYPFTQAALVRGADVTEPDGADTWVLPPDDPRAPKPALPPPPKPDTRPRIHQIMGDLANTKRFMDDPNLAFEDVRPSVVACWNSHYSLLRRFATEGGSPDATMLIMEDDVDIEFEFEATLRAEMAGLPADWDILLPGYCDSTETDHKPVPGHPRLRRSHHPLCNHGYIVSRRGARRLVSLFRSPSFAYSRPHDQAKQYLIRQGLINSYSITPVQIVQEHKLVSDLRPGTGGGWWDDDLTDSALQRAQLLLDQEVAAAGEVLASS